MYEPSNGHDLAAKIQEILTMSDQGACFGKAARETMTRPTCERNAHQVIAIAGSEIAKINARS